MPGFKFLEGGILLFIEHRGASMKGLFVPNVAVIIGRGVGEAVGRVLSALSGAGVVSLFEAPVYTGVEGQELVQSPASGEEFGGSVREQRWEVKGFERSLFSVA